MNLLQKSKRAISEGGLTLLIKRGINYLYRKISPVLPQRYRFYNGVKVPSHKVFGEIIPFTKTEERPNYEEGLIKSLEQNVEEDNKIIICGGGLGVTAVRAARLNENPSNITVYEGSKSQIEKIKKTLRKNNLENIDIIHAIIGEEKNIWGDKGSAKNIKASEIPECDLLELDIEGSEIGVLKNLEITPNTIIVESHGEQGAPTEEVKSLLNKKGYSIRNVELAENVEHAKKNDINVVTGKFKS